MSSMPDMLRVSRTVVPLTTTSNLDLAAIPAASLPSHVPARDLTFWNAAAERSEAKLPKSNTRTLRRSRTEKIRRFIMVSLPESQRAVEEFGGKELGIGCYVGTNLQARPQRPKASFSCSLSGMTEAM